MVETTYGVRSYTCSDKTKRPQKKQVDLKKLEKRNATQKKLYITLDNIDLIFSNNEDEFPVCYNMIFNLIQGKVTKFFNTRNYDRKKELSYDCMNRLYSILKRKLLKLHEEEQHPVLFFYVSQFFRYVELVVFSTFYYGTQDQKYLIQEPEEFNTDDIINGNSYLDPLDELDTYLNNTSNKVINCISNNKNLSSKEKKLLLKIQKNCYSKFGSSNLTKRETELLESIKLRIESENDLLTDLEELLNAQR